MGMLGECGIFMKYADWYVLEFQWFACAGVDNKLSFFLFV